MTILQGLAACGMALCAAWKGEVGDDRLFYSTYSGSEWTTPAQNTLPGNSSVGPSLAWSIATSELYAAWKEANGGTRTFFSTLGANGWSPQTQMPGYSDTGPALASLNGTLYAVWKGENGDPTLWWSSYTESPAGGWQPQQQIVPATGAVPNSAIGPSLAAFDGQLYMAWRGADGVDTCWYATYSPTSGWSAQAPIPDTASTTHQVESTTGPSLAVYGGELYAAFRGGYSDGQTDRAPDQGLYYTTLTTASGWSGTKYPIPGESSSSGPALGTMPNGDLYAMWSGASEGDGLYYASFNGTWSYLGIVPGNTGQDVAPRPEDGLGDNSNYAMTSGCNPIENLTVTLAVTEDIVWESSLHPGFTIQLNAYSAPDLNVGWQQYVMQVDTTGVTANVDNWPSKTCSIPGCTQGKNLINDISGAPHFLSAPTSTPTLPAGTTITISVGRNAGDPEWNIANATYTVSGPLATESACPSYFVGPDTCSYPLVIYSPTGGLNYAPPLSGPVTAAGVAPIVGFQLDLVGHPEDDNTPTVLASGAATITYAATTALTPLDKVGACSENWTITGEKANTSYSTLAPGTSTWIQQYITVN